MKDYNSQRKDYNTIDLTLADRTEDVPLDHICQLESGTSPSSTERGDDTHQKPLKGRITSSKRPQQNPASTEVLGFVKGSGGKAEKSKKKR